ncbi:PQQ-binding-like beta-propeller repeat protein [bacterium]|nr:PQQ-binding-like beta-propeller repeat protein [bacterium]
MKRSRVLPLVLLLAASVSTGATRTTVMHRVRQQSAAALRSIREEVKSWMAVMRRGATGTRKGIAGAGASITRGGRQAIDGVKGTAQYLGRETRRQVHDTMTLVAREFVPVGERATVRAESTAPMAVPSPISEPAFLRAHDIQLAWHITTAGRDIRQSLLMDDNLLLEDLGNDIYALDPRNGIANWVFPLPARSMYDLTEGDETIAVVANDVLYDLDRDVGLPRIRFVLPFPTASQPALYGDSVILGSADDRIYSLNRKDRTREWSYLATGHVFAGVAVKANTVYFGQTNGKVFAYQPGSRRPMWE